MADTFSGKAVVSLDWNWQESEGGFKDSYFLRFAKSIAEGFDSAEAEAVWYLENIELLDGASDTYDLTNLLRTVLGDTLSLNLYTVRFILIVNLSTAVTDGQLLVGGAAANEWHEPFGIAGDKVRVPLNSPHLFANYHCGWEVDDSNKNLKIAASGGDVTYSIAIIGTDTVATGDCSSSGL